MLAYMMLPRQQDSCHVLQLDRDHHHHAWHRVIADNHSSIVLPFAALSAGKRARGDGIAQRRRGYHRPHRANRGGMANPLPHCSRLTANTYQDGMRRLRARMIKYGLGDAFWAAHNLKRKGYSEGEDDDLTGHKSQQMKKRYRVLPKKVKPSK